MCRRSPRGMGARPHDSVLPSRRTLVDFTLQRLQLSLNVVEAGRRAEDHYAHALVVAAKLIYAFGSRHEAEGRGLCKVVPGPSRVVKVRLVLDDALPKV